ncbi:MAG: radical SAM protein [Thermoprotei archaeon]|nr:MAG: radical SAM protein [Thermoprotei archaeon]
MEVTLSKWLGKEEALVAMSRWDWDSPIYLSWYKGRRVPLFKTLLASYCVNECRYCAFRKGRRVYRSFWKIEKLVDKVLELWKRGRISGFFLSSSVFKDPEDVVEKEIEVAKMLRTRGFTGYINLRLMPGTPRYLIEEACRVADRVGVNVEAATPDVFYEIAPDKGSYKYDILRILKIASKIGREKGLLKAGVATQLIVGVGNTDFEILKLTEFLVKKHKLARVFYSPFEPIPDTPLEKLLPCSSKRVRRLYQAFYLIRDYGFTLKDFELLLDDSNMLKDFKNLKEEYAREHKNLYPVDLNSASYEELLKIPGVGPRTAKKILFLRNRARLNRDILVKIVGLKRFKEITKYISI